MIRKLLGLLGPLGLLALFLPGIASAQLTGPVQWVGPVTAGHCTAWLAPGIAEDAGANCGGSGSLPTCTLNQLVYYAASGNSVLCLTLGSNLSITAGTLNATGGGGSSAFSALTSGTNTAAAMLVGTGASLAATGSGTITATSSPLAGLTGVGTGVSGALATNVGTAGAFVVNGGALGTPSSGTLTSATGLPISTGVSGLGTGVATFLGSPTATNLGAAVTGAGLVAGTNVTITGTWPNQTINSSGSGGSVTLQTNGTNNASQTTLNLQNGPGVVVSNPSGGNAAIAQTQSYRTVTTTTDTISCTTDAANAIRYNSASAVAVAVPQATGSCGAGFAFNVQNYGVGTATLTPTTSTINGSASFAVAQGQGCAFVSDGTNYWPFSCTALVTGGGSGTVNSATTPELAYYAATGTAVSGAPDATISSGALTLGVAGSAVGSVVFDNATSGSITVQPPTGALGSITITWPTITGTVAMLTGAPQEFTSAMTFGSQIKSFFNGATSTSGLAITGGLFTGGTGTTTFPWLYFSNGATAPTTFSTGGTYFGVNAASGFSGNFFDFYVNGTEEASLSASGALTVTSCTGCSGSSSVFQVNGTNLASTATINFENGSVHNGLTVAVTNPSSGNVSYALTGNYLPSVATAASATSVTPNCTNDFVKVTASATGTFTVNAPGTCTPVDGQKLELKVVSPSGGTITYSWNATYIASATLALPTTSNAASKEDYFSFQYDGDKSGWVFLADNQGF